MDALEIKALYWKKEWKIPGTSWVISGYSRSAYRTGFYISYLNLMLDAGPQNFNRPSNILITHTHIDHICCLPMTMLGDTKTEHIFNVYAPTKAEPYIKNYISSMFAVNAMTDKIDPSKWYQFHGLDPHIQPIKLSLNKIDTEIEVFECDHALPTISYGISETKKKLKEEYISLAGKDIGQLRKSGVEVTNNITTKKLAYVCDTSIKVFELNPTLLTYPVIFIECTFFMPDELENAQQTRHIHWEQLKPIVIANPHIQFMLFHFSQRYRDTEITEFFTNETTTKGITNIAWW